MKNRIFTTIQITKEVNENLRQLKHKFHYKSNNDLLEDMSRYFIDYNVSPREASKPIFEQFKIIDKTFRSFFKEYENKLFKPFVNAQSEVNLELLKFIENQSISEKKSGIKEFDFENKKENFSKEDSHTFSEMEYEKLKNLITFLEEKIFENVKQEYREDDVFYLIHTFNFFGLKDIFNEVKWYFKRD